MRAMERVIEHAAQSADQMEFARGLQPGSPVVVVRVSIEAFPDVVVTAITPDGVLCSDGKTYSLDGHYNGSHGHCRFLVEPTDKSREAVLLGSYRRDLQHFPWGKLTLEQMEAVLKFARSKYCNSPRVRAT